MKRLDVIDVVAAGIPRGSGGEAGKGKGEYRADLKNPTHWVIVEVYKVRCVARDRRDTQASSLLSR